MRKVGEQRFVRDLRLVKIGDEQLAHHAYVSPNRSQINRTAAAPRRMVGDFADDFIPSPLKASATADDLQSPDSDRGWCPVDAIVSYTRAVGNRRRRALQRRRSLCPVPLFR